MGLGASEKPGALWLTTAFGLQMDELQGSMWQLRAFMDESTQCLQKVSVQLGECLSGCWLCDSLWESRGQDLSGGLCFSPSISDVVGILGQ